MTWALDAARAKRAEEKPTTQTGLLVQAGKPSGEANKDDDEGDKGEEDKSNKNKFKDQKDEEEKLEEDDDEEGDVEEEK